MWDELIELVESLEPAIKQAALVSLARLRRGVNRRAVELAWANGDADAVTFLLMGDSAVAWAPLRNAVVEAIQTAAMDTVSLHIKGAGRVLNVVMGLTEDPRVLQAVQARLVREVDASTRSALTKWVRDSMQEGAAPARAITEIVGSVDLSTGARMDGVLGLTERQMAAVRNYRRMLQEGQFGEAMTRQLRDKRFDPTLKRGESLSSEQVDRMVARYEARMLAYRAQTIARTESARAQAHGQRQAWNTAIEQGEISADEVVKRWVTAGDLRVRDHHVPMNNQIIPYSKLFIVHGGSLKKPRTDHVFGPPHEPNCRCVLSIRPLLDRSQPFAEYAG